MAVADYGRKKRKWLAVQGVTDRDRLPGRWESHRPEDVGWKKDVSGLKRFAQTLAIILREHGLKRLPAVLEEFVGGDVDDLFESIKEFAVMLKGGNEAIVKELDGTFERMLYIKLSTPKGRAVLAARLVEAEKIAEAAKTAAPIAAAVAVAV